MTPNPRLSHLLIIFIFTIAACSPAPTQPPVVFDIENSVDALPTVTAAILSEMPTNSEIILTPDPKNTLVPQTIPTGDSSIQFYSLKRSDMVNRSSPGRFLPQCHIQNHHNHESEHRTGCGKVGVLCQLRFRN